jgi:pyrimidine-specific ribonucleoside hydrolase
MRCRRKQHSFNAILVARMAAAHLLLLSLAAAALAQTGPILIDTDAGSDDLLAIAFLVSHPSVHIEAVTIANGTAHVDAGARNVARLLDLAGRPQIPVFAGRSAPLRGNAEFPAEWRRLADELPGITLPPLSHPVQTKSASAYLAERLKSGRPRVRILALGPLTNLGEALERDPSIANAITEIVIMGGAVHAPGNLGDGGVFPTNNTTAEWNIFVDPLAARVVFRAGIHIRLISLDATNKVPIRAEFVRNFRTAAHSPLASFVAQVLESDRETIAAGIFYAWDPLAAVALLHPAIVKTTRVHIDIRQDPPEAGRMLLSPGTPNAEVALDADGVAFHDLFLAALTK